MVTETKKLNETVHKNKASLYKNEIVFLIC